VNFGFLDFTSLEDRKHFCNEELRLNQRLTKDLYLEVLPITGSAEAPQLGGDGPVIEYALKMRQFPQSQLLSTLQANGELTSAHRRDGRADRAFPPQRTESPTEHPPAPRTASWRRYEQNFEQIRPFLSDKADLLQLEALQAWAESSFERLKPLLAQRKAEGFHP
jgi:aminoglycoside phosphotransferase family enzyme